MQKCKHISKVFEKIEFFCYPHPPAAVADAQMNSLVQDSV